MTGRGLEDELADRGGSAALWRDADLPQVGLETARIPGGGIGDCAPCRPHRGHDVPSLLEALAERAAARAERHLHLDAPGLLLPHLRPLPGAERPPRRRRGRPASRPARPRRPTEALTPQDPYIAGRVWARHRVIHRTGAGLDAPRVALTQIVN